MKILPNSPNQSGPACRQAGIVQLPILIAVVALLGFLFISSNAPLKDSLFSMLYPKPTSEASSDPREAAKPQKPLKKAKSHILIKFKKDADNNKKSTAISEEGLDEFDQITEDGLKIMNIPDNKSPQEVVDKLKNKYSDIIELIETDEINIVDESGRKVLGLTSGTFNLVGTHPHASAQWTELGKTISSLISLNGKIYSGYGDYGSNTGPINISAFDPATKTFSESLLSAPTESIDNLRIINGQVYGNYTDPQGGLQNVAYAVGEPWVNPTTYNVDAIHIFDVNTLNGSDLIAVGSAYSGSGHAAAVWRSTDGGNNWTTMIQEEPLLATDYSRYYFAGVLNNKLYVSAYDNSAGNHVYSKVYDGTSWTSGPNLFSICSGEGSKPNIFNGKMVFKSWESPWWGYLKTFDGNKDTCITSFTVYDYVIDGAYLYALDTNGVIRRTSDMNSWLTIGTAPNTSRSITIANGIIYVGTIEATLYAYSENVNTSPTPTPTPTSTPTPVPSPVELIPPTVSITSPTNNAAVSRNSNFTINVTAADNVGVAKVEFYVDNALKCTDTSSPYSCTTKISGKPGAVHSISAKAYDIAGNSASAVISVKTN